MHLLGRANWWMPTWLGRVLPELHVEGHPDDHLPARATATATSTV
jgi:RND superfamily putative drug exporter